MQKLHDVSVYLLKHYPNRNQLSQARFVKLIYLSDWKHAIEHGSQITGTMWYYNNYGPFVKDIVEELKNDPDFKVTAGENIYGGSKVTIGLDNLTAGWELSEKEQETINFVIKSTQNMLWESFINLVYSTYPIQFSPRHSDLNLVELAKEYAPFRKQLQQQQSTG